MRYLGLVLAGLTVALAAPAAAQHSAGGGTPMGDLMDLNQFATRGFMNQWSATRPTHLSGMSPSAEAWLDAQVQIQAETPRSPQEVAAAIDATLGEAIDEAAKAEGVRPRDVSRALVLKVMLDTKSALAREARRVGGVAAPGAPSWEERLAQADANRRAALALQSTTSLALATD
jgi:hypothetical protein